MGRAYIAIDLKSFYASVECVERGLDPLTAKLVVADESRTDGTICLAVSPALRALGVPGRARLYEAKRIARDFVIAPPRMKKYMEISTKIFGIYAGFVSPDDMHVYSVDEVFIDATSYLKNYKMTAHELAMAMIKKVLAETGITATVGIGSNMYLAKIAMDIEAKHMPADMNGVRIAELDEMSYRRKLWGHTPITDFWRVGRGYARRLARLGIYTMGDLARYSMSGAEKLYAEFGVNAELLIDHAWGYEPVTMQDIKKYKTNNHSVSSGQVLSGPYDYDRARVVVSEMADALALDMVRCGLTADQIVLTVGYDVGSAKKYMGEIVKDRYGRSIPKHAHGTINLGEYTNSASKVIHKVLELFDRIVDKDLKVRRMYVVANHVIHGGRNKMVQLDIFTDYEKLEEEMVREQNMQKAILKIKSRYGKNAILKGINFEDGATMRERNKQIGGHLA